MRRLNLFVLSLFLCLPLSAAADKLIGIGYLNGLVGLNLEWAGERNSFHAMPSTYIGSGGAEQDEFRWVAGWRRKMERGQMNESGFYSGLMAGDMGGDSRAERLGAGLEIGHQWVNDFTRWTLGATIAVLEPQDCADYRSASDCSTPEQRKRRDLDAEPAVVLGISVSLRR